MTKILVLLSLLFCTIADARTTYQVPEDAVIKVFTKDGKQIGEMSRSEYKVVKIRNEVKKAVEPEIIIIQKKKKNDLILHVGKAPNGLDVDKKGTTYEIERDDELVFGATYCYSPEKQDYDLGMCGTYLTNDTFLGGLKIGF